MTNTLPEQTLTILADQLLQKTEHQTKPVNGTYQKNIAILAEIARHPKTPTNILHRLHKINSLSIQLQLAQNPACPPDILEELSRHRDYAVLQGVAANPNCPQTTLDKLLYSTYEDVRFACLQNPGCDHQTALKLAKENHWELEVCLAINPNTPQNILQKLAQTDSLYIQEILAKNPKTSTKILWQLAQRATRAGEEALAENPNCGPETIDLLIKTQNPYVLQNLAKNRSTNTTQLQQLQGQHPILDQKIASNPNCDITVSDYIIKNLENQNLSTQIDHLVNLANLTEKLLANNTKKQLYRHTITLLSTDNQNDYKTVLENLYNTTISKLADQPLTTAEIVTIQKLAQNQGWKTPNFTQQKPVIPIKKPAKTTLQIKP